MVYIRIMQKKRFEELEGLRGVAAVIVAIYHFCLTFYLFAFFGPSADGIVQHVRYEDNFYGSPFAVFLSGTFAVAIFFVLSGFVLSIGFFQTGKLEIVKKLAAKRYLRLMLPALASTLVCFLIVSAGVIKTQQAATIIHSSWLTTQWQFSPNLLDALKSGVYGIFVNQGSPFNGVLWTMKTEFFGSFIVFGFLSLFGKVKYRWIAYTFLFIATFNTWFLAFIAGMMLADMFTQGKLVTKNRSWLFIAPLLFISLYLGGYPIVGAEHTVFYGIFSTINATIHWDIVLMSFGAIGLILLVLLSQQVAKPFASKALSSLGKYTFSLYLVHIPVIFTVGLTAFLVFYNGLGASYNIAVVMAFLVSALVVAGSTLLFERYIDSPSIAFSSKVARIFLGEEALAWNPKTILEKLNGIKEWRPVAWRSGAVPQSEDIEE